MYYIDLGSILLVAYKYTNCQIEVLKLHEPNSDHR
jgi:hypothetical protein